MARNGYSTCLTDARWALIAPHLPPPKPGGRSRRTDLQAIANAILHVYAWAASRVFSMRRPALGHGVVGPSTLATRWRLGPIASGALSCRWEKTGRRPDPAGGTMDRQSVNTTEPAAFAAMPGAIGPRDASGRCSLIHTALLSPAVSSLRACPIAARPASRSRAVPARPDHSQRDLRGW